MSILCSTRNVVFTFIPSTLAVLKKQPHNLVKYSLIICALSASSAWSQHLSPADAAQKARDTTQGKVLKVKKISGNTVNYRVKILSPEGRVKHILIDGNTGEVRNRTDK